MSKNLFESLQTAASATRSPISCSSYGKQSDTGDLVIHEEAQNDEEEDDLLDLVLRIDESKGKYDSGDCTKPAKSDSASVDRVEGMQATNSVTESASTRETVRNESEFCPSILMNEYSTSPLLSSQDVVSSSDSSSRSIDKNIWKRLAGKSMLPKASLPLPDNEDWDKHSSRSATMEVISERGSPYFSPIHNSLSELNQFDISKSVSDSKSNKSDNADHDTYVHRKDVKIGPLVECISEKQPITGPSTGHEEFVVESRRSRIHRQTDSYSIESGEIFSSEDGDSEDDGTKELLIDEDAEEEDSDTYGNQNEERAEETEDTEWCSETTQPFSEDSDEDTERASIDSEINNLIIAFPDPSEESPQNGKNDTDASCLIASPDPSEGSPQNGKDDTEASCLIASPGPSQESPQNSKNDTEASCLIASPDPSEESPQNRKNDTEASCLIASPDPSEESPQNNKDDTGVSCLIAFPEPSEESPQNMKQDTDATCLIASPDPFEENNKDDTGASCIQEEVQESSDEKKDANYSVKEAGAANSLTIKEPADNDVHNDKESDKIKIEPSDGELRIMEDEVKEVCDLTVSPIVVKKEELPPRTSNRQVSFFEKAADLLCLNLFDNSDVYLSSPPKSVFSNFVKTEAISEDEPLDTSKKNSKVSMKSVDTLSNIETKVTEVSKSPKSPDVPQASLLYESCSVNELLLKEEEEEEDEEEREGQETVAYKTTDGPGSSQEGLSVLGNIVDRLAPGKDEDSRLSLISKRLRNRMPHWDDSFNEAFVPQIHSKPSTASASTSSSSSNHNSSDSHKRSKTTNQSNDMQFKSVTHETYRDPITFVPQHVKKVRQFLTALNVCQDKVEDKREEEPTEEALEHCLSSLKMGSPNPKSTALRARKHSYHDSKKALRLPQKLIRSLPSPSVADPEDDISESVAPGPSTPSTSMEFRSSLGASVRTKPRAFTKAALRRQIIEEASTAKPQFRVKTRPTADDGTGALAIVITRVTRPPHAKRSLSSDPRAETNNLQKADETDEKSKTMSGECSKGSASNSCDVRQGSDAEGMEDHRVTEIEQKKNDADNIPEGLSTTTRNSGEKRKLEESLSKSFEASKTTCSADAHDGAPKRRRRDSDSSATSSSRDRNTPINSANSSYQSSTRASSQSPPKNVSGKNDARNMSNPDETQSQSFDEDASCRNAVNFRGVASNRKRLKGQKKHRLLQEIENTSGFLMDQSKTDTREQRALERLLQQNAELHSGNHSDKQADSSVHSSPRVLLDRLSPDQIKRKGKIRSNRRRNFNQRDALRDYKNPNPDTDQRKLKNTVNVAAANRITAKYAAAKIDRARGGASNPRELASIHPRVRALIRRSSGRDVYGRTALHLAAALGQLESVMYCLKLNIGLNEHDHSGLYPIHAASRNGNVAVIKALLEAGADVNMCAGADGISPLHEAASGGKFDAVKELVARGADRTLVMYDGTTPTDWAMNEEIRCFLESNEPGNTNLSEVGESVPVVDDDNFELYDRNPPLVFTIWLESTQKKSEVLLLSELCDFCGLDKVNIRIHKPCVHIVKISMQQLHKGMRNNILWPALRLRLRIEGSLQEHKSFENPSRSLIALVLYTDEIRTLTGGIGISLSKEEVEKVKDPPTPPKLVRNRQPMVQNEKVNGIAMDRRGDAVTTDVKVKKEICTKPRPIIMADSKPSPAKMSPAKPVICDKTPYISQNLNLDDSADSSGSSTDEDVVITGIFSAPKRPPSLSCERKYTPNSGVPLPRKRPVASVIPNRVQPQMKSRRLSHESDSDHDRLQLREEFLRDYEQIKIERRNLEKKELQLKERILEMHDPRRQRARVPSDDKSRDPPRKLLTHDTSEDGHRFPASSQSSQRPRVPAALIPMSSASSRPSFRDIAISQSSEIPEGSASNPLQRVLPTTVSSRPPVMSPETSHHLSRSNPFVYDSLIVKRGHLSSIRMQKPVERPCLAVTSTPPFSTAVPLSRKPRYPSALRYRTRGVLSKVDPVYSSSVPSVVRPASVARPSAAEVYSSSAPSMVLPASAARPSPAEVYSSSIPSVVLPASVARPSPAEVFSSNVPSVVLPASVARPSPTEVYSSSVPSVVLPASVARPSPTEVFSSSVPSVVRSASVARPSSTEVYSSSVPSVVRPASVARPSPTEVYSSSVPSVVRSASVARPSPTEVYSSSVPSVVRSASVARPSPTEVYSSSVPSVVRPASLARPSSDVANRHSIQRFVPATVPNSSLLFTPQFLTRIRPLNPSLVSSAILSAPTLDIPETPGSNSSSINDLLCSPPGSPPLLVPQGPVAVQSTASRVSPVLNSAPPLLFPQEPPVLLPCPKIADTTYPSNNGRVEMHAVSERDEAPPLLIPSNPPPNRGVKCASELLKKRSSSEIVPNKSIPNHGIPAPRVSESSKKSVIITSPDMVRYDPPLPSDSPIPLKKTRSDASSENDSGSDKSKIRLNLPPPILTSPEKRCFEIHSEKCVTVKDLSGAGTRLFQSNQRYESSPQLNKLKSVPIKEKQNFTSKTGVLKLNSDRRKKLPLISFHSDGQTISVVKQAKKVNEIKSFNRKCIDLTGLSPPGTPVVE